MNDTKPGLTTTCEADSSRSGGGPEYGPPGMDGDLADILRRMQKTEGIGRLADGVVHELNNLLAVIMSGASSCSMELDPEDTIREDLGDILLACRRARGLLGSLRDFAAEGDHAHRPVSLNRIVERAKALLEHTISPNVEFRTELEPGLADVRADPNELDQVLLNLVYNALDAMGNTGTIVFKTHSVIPGSAELEAFPELAGRHCVRLEVTDSGEGMDPTTLNRAFEPFFSTRRRQLRAGLGLFIARNGVERNCGKLLIRSEPRRGTTVAVILPELDVPRLSQDANAGAAVTRAPEGFGKILLVDDEDLFRLACAKLLRRCGYSVLPAKNGAEAVAIFKERRDEIELAILDLVMPIMDGPETSRQLRALDSEVKVLFCSGRSEGLAAIEAQTQAGPKVGFVKKPFEIQDLLAAITTATRGES